MKTLLATAAAAAILALAGPVSAQMYPPMNPPYATRPPRRKAKMSASEWNSSRFVST